MSPMPCVVINSAQGARLIRLGDRSAVIRTILGHPVDIWDCDCWVLFVQGEARLMGQIRSVRVEGSVRA